MVQFHPFGKRTQNVLEKLSELIISVLSLTMAFLPIRVWLSFPVMPPYPALLQQIRYPP